MNRTETEAAISGYLPRRARRHLDAIMAAVDAHAAAGREDLDRVVAEGARRQKLVAEEFRRVKAEAAELGKQVRVLVEERAAALAEGNRLRQERAEQDQAFGGAVRRIHDLTAEVGEAATERDRLRQQLDDIAAEHAVRVSELEAADAERDRLRAVIQRVLADEESGEGGWGPDVTMVTVLREALEPQPAPAPGGEAWAAKPWAASRSTSTGAAG